MNPEQEKRYRSAERIAELCREHLGAKVALITGSVAKGRADAASDVDMTVYYDVPPTMQGLEKVRAIVGGSDRIFTLGDLDEGDFAEFYYVDGIKHDIVHGQPSSLERDLADVLEKHQAESPYQKILSGLLDSKAFYGQEILDRWQAMARNYPDGLAVNMIKLHLGFPPLWILTSMGSDRDDWMVYYEFLMKTCTNVMGVLMGLNKLYHWGEYKHAAQLAEQMRIKPDRVVERINFALRGDPREATDDMTNLVQDVLELVELHRPEIDTSATRRRLGIGPSMAVTP